MKFLSYFAYVVVFGLLQFWVAIGLIWANDASYSIALQDGGLFFFSTSLVITSLFDYSEKCSVKTASLKLFSIGAFIVLVFSIVFYCDGFLNALHANKSIEFLGKVNFFQILFGSLAIVYSILIEAHLGTFSKTQISPTGK